MSLNVIKDSILFVSDILLCSVAHLHASGFLHNDIAVRMHFALAFGCFTSTLLERP